MPFLPFALSSTSPRRPHPFAALWSAQGPGTGPRSSQCQATGECQVQFGPAMSLGGCVGFHHFCMCLGCVTWHFQTCFFLLRSFPMYALSAPARLRAFKTPSLSHPPGPWKCVCVCPMVMFALLFFRGGMDWRWIRCTVASQPSYLPLDLLDQGAVRTQLGKPAELRG